MNTIWTIEHKPNAVPVRTTLRNIMPSLQHEFAFTALHITECFENGESFVTRTTRYSADLQDLMRMWQTHHGGTR